MCQVARRQEINLSFTMGWKPAGIKNRFGDGGSGLMKSAIRGGLAAILVVAAGTGLPVRNSRLWGSASASASPSRARITASAGESVAEPVIIDTRIGEHSDRTRFVVELSDPVKARAFTLANPDRIIIDMPEALWRVRSADRPSGQGAIEQYRYGLFRPGDSRFVIDLKRPVAVKEPVILPPRDGHGYRVIVDLLPTSQETFDRTSGWPADVVSPPARVVRDNAVGAAFAPPKTAVAVGSTDQKRVIVIDAGHGGVDSGTQGYDGQLEKDLVLDESLRLGRVLGQRDYTVHFTRNEDVYIPLRERVDAARTVRADLFISLHADSNPDPKVFGASVYTLSAASSDAEAAALARKENQSDVIAGVDLGGESSPVASILIGLAQRDTINRSIRFADTLVPQLERATDVLPRDPHRSAGFVVLKAPDVPAVLVELGYLSNPADCARMASNAWREKIALAIADAVDRQFHGHAREQLSAEAAK